MIDRARLRPAGRCFTHMRGGLLLLFLSLAGASAQEAERPNILVILTDDQRADAMGCYGNGSLRTPHFDSIAREGARFDDFHTAAPLSCPSRAALLTGLYPHQNGVLDNGPKADLRRDAVTIPRLLRKAGYATGFVGKAHLGGDPRKWGFEDCPLWLPGGSSRHCDPVLRADGVEKEVPGEITALFVDAAIRWIEKRKGERWFLWLATTAPHTPYLLDPQHGYASSEIEAPPLWPRAESLSDSDWAGYYSTITMLDERVGRLLARLKELGLLDRTFLFVTSDSGIMHGSHGYGGKQVWYDEAVRVPALARWPGRIAPATRVSAPVVSVDVLPTLCDVAGAEKPAGLEGVSFLPALQGKDSGRRFVYSEVRMEPDGHWQMVRAERYKYVRFAGRREHLFDIWHDPGEIRDLATGARHVDTLEEMNTLLQQWREATK